MTEFFKNKLEKPSAAVQAMIDGLRDMDKEPGIEIEMGYFCRKKHNSLCMVCAATAAAMQVTQTPVETLLSCAEGHEDMRDDWNILAEAMQISAPEIIGFEMMMNALRLGYAGSLMEYFDVPKGHPAYGIDCPWFLDTFHWRERLALVGEYRDKLIAVGL